MPTEPARWLHDKVNPSSPRVAIEGAERGDVRPGGAPARSAGIGPKVGHCADRRLCAASLRAPGTRATRTRGTSGFRRSDHRGSPCASRAFSTAASITRRA